MQIIETGKKPIPRWEVWVWVAIIFFVMIVPTVVLQIIGSVLFGFGLFVLFFAMTFGS